MQRSWNYQERWRTIPLSAKNTTIPSTSRKQKNQTTQLELLRTLKNISSVSQQYYSLFNFKEAKEWNNIAGIIKNAEQHFLWLSRVIQRLHVHQRRMELARKLDISSVSQGFYIVQVYRGRRMEKKWSRLEHWTTYTHCWSRILQIAFKFNEKSRRMENNWTYLDMQHFAVSQKTSVISLRSTKPDQEWNKKKCSRYRYLSPTTNLPFCDL